VPIKEMVACEKEREESLRREMIKAREEDEESLRKALGDRPDKNDG
jgi:hypothetical protein